MNGGILLQSGPIGASSLGIWAITFIFSGVVVVVSWLVRRHYNIAVPAYERIFGPDDDPTDAGHLQDTESRFNSVDQAVAELNRKTEQLHDDIRKVERRQEVVLSNQSAIADALDVDLERPHFYRGGRGDVSPDGGDADAGD